MKKTLLILLAALSSFFAPGQLPDAEQGLLPPPVPKIHLHLDKDIYLPGETVWFKAYLLSNGLPDSLIANLFSELRSESGETIARFVSPVTAGIATGQFTLPGTMETGSCSILSFTRGMAADTAGRVYTKNIFVQGSKQNSKPAQRAVSLQLFAEGGTFIHDVENTIAFKAMYSDGTPFPLHGVIKDNNHRFIDSIHAFHDGMGSFIFFPSPAETYYVEWKDNTGQTRITPFPSAISKGVALHITRNENELIYQLQNPFPEGNLSEIQLSISRGSSLLWAGSFPMQERISGKINTLSLPDGIVQITAYDREWQPLAERIVFINNNMMRGKAGILPVEENTAPRGLNIFELEIPDSLENNLSVAVCDNDMMADDGSTIQTDILLGNEIRGYVYRPAQYFDGPAEKMVPALDLVMLTNGWRSYKRNEITVPSPGDELLYAAEDHISFYGKVTLPGNPSTETPLISLTLRTTDSVGNAFAISPDDKGLFQQNGLIFHDSATLYYYFLRAPKGAGITITQGNPAVFPLLPSAVVPGIPVQWPAGSNGPLPENKKSFLFSALSDTFEKKGKLLPEVILKSKNPLQAMDDKYAKIYKGDKGGRMYDFMHNPSAVNQADPVGYMFNWMLPMRFLHPWFEIYINEIQAPPPSLKYLRSDQIAFIKYVPEDFQKPDCSGIYIYLKTEDDYLEEMKAKLKSSMSHLKLAGYSPKKIFYHPDYSINPGNANPGKDVQTTLFWDPEIKTGKENRKVRIRFSNNDISTRLRIVVEGMNSAGKLVHLEKIIK